MKTKQALLVSATAALALGAFAPADKVSFQPEAGLSLARTFASKHSLTLDDMTMKINGNDQPMPSMDMSMDMHSNYAITDELGATEEGRPAKVTRSFDKLEQGGSMSVDLSALGQGEKQTDIKATSKLEGKKIVFQWNAEKREYDVRFADDGGDDELLEGLTEDMDFRALLPTGEVSTGDAWDVDVKRLDTLLAPGGNLKLEPEAGDDMDAMGMNNMDFSQMFSDLLEGTAKADYLGTRDVDGVSCGVIHVKIDISGSRDMTDVVQEQMADAPTGDMKPEIEHVDIEFKLEGEGELLWNLRAGHAHGFKLEGTIKLNTDMGMAMPMGDQKMNFEQNMEMSGSYETQVEFAKS